MIDFTDGNSSTGAGSNPSTLVVNVDQKPTYYDEPDSLIKQVLNDNGNVDELYLYAGIGLLDKDNKQTYKWVQVDIENTIRYISLQVPEIDKTKLANYLSANDKFYEIELIEESNIYKTPYQNGNHIYIGGRSTAYDDICYFRSKKCLIGYLNASAIDNRSYIVDKQSFKFAYGTTRYDGEGTKYKSYYRETFSFRGKTYYLFAVTTYNKSDLSSIVHIYISDKPLKSYYFESDTEKDADGIYMDKETQVLWFEVWGNPATGNNMHKWIDTDDLSAFVVDFLNNTVKDN